jgi:hypothetical protein
MEKNSGVLANTFNQILRYKGSTLYRALTVLKNLNFLFNFGNKIIQNLTCARFFRRAQLQCALKKEIINSRSFEKIYKKIYKLFNRVPSGHRSNSGIHSV